MALGLIVKLKDGTLPSVVRLQAMQRPSDSDASQRDRLAAVARRKLVAYAVRKPTAFGAQLIHSRQLLTHAQAEAQAQRLRADPDVEWVIVNDVERAAALPVGGYVAPSPPNQNAVPPPDALYGRQWWLHPSGAGNEGVANVATAWQRLAGQTLYPVVLALMDTGSRDSPALPNRWWPGYDFVSELPYAKDGNGLDADPSDPGDGVTQAEVDQNPLLYPSSFCGVHADSWHGTAVAGLLAATSGSGLDAMGMLPQLGTSPAGGPVVMPVRVSGACGANVSDLIEGMLWAAGVPYQGSPPANPLPARVLNLSFGGSGSCAANGTVHDAAWLYRQTVATLRSKGVLVVASAGNGDGHTGAAVPTRPASCEGVLAVTGLSRRGLKAHYANLLSQGVAVASGELPEVTGGTDDYLILAGYIAPSAQAVFEAGTSFAAPMAAGVAAMMLAIDPSITVDQLHTALTTQVRPHVTLSDFGGTSVYGQCVPGIGQQRCLCTADTCGSGILDADLAVAWALNHAAQNGGAQAATTLDVSASWFAPDRLASASASSPSASPSSGGGGGGAAPHGLVGLALWLWAARWVKLRGGRR